MKTYSINRKDFSLTNSGNMRKNLDEKHTLHFETYAEMVKFHEDLGYTWVRGSIKNNFDEFTKVIGGTTFVTVVAKEVK